jgi:hypothetical protein
MPFQNAFLKHATSSHVPLNQAALEFGLAHEYRFVANLPTREAAQRRELAALL